jgi:hypothetical protein
MVNYQNGKIYKITGTNNEGIKLIYIGSTVQKLCVRLAEHVRYVKNGRFCSSSLVLICNDYEITLIELYPCNSREELLMRERYYYDMVDCVNQQKPVSLEGERYEYIKQYYIENKDRIGEYHKQYYIDNIENKKQYYIKNIDTILENKKQYRIKNREIIREKDRQSYLKKKENKTL